MPIILRLLTLQISIEGLSMRKTSSKEGHSAKVYFSKTSKPSYKSPVTGYSSASKDYKAKYKKMKAKLALLESSPSTSHNPKTFQPKNKGLVAKTFDCDEEEVSDDEEVTQVKVLMALADDELTDSLNKSISRTVTASETEPTTPSVPTEVKNTKQESKINELTKLVQILINEKINSNQKTHKSKSQIQQTESSKPDDCRNYPDCEICGSYDHFTSEHNRVIHIRGGVLAESSQSSESSIDVKCNACEIIVHFTTDYNEFDHFKRETHHGAHLVPGQWMLKEYDWCQELSTQVCRATRS
ncbi:hypothetical protein Tco_0722097 [Tanacetum coccineum]